MILDFRFFVGIIKFILDSIVVLIKFVRDYISGKKSSGLSVKL